MARFCHIRWRVAARRGRGVRAWRWRMAAVAVVWAWRAAGHGGTTRSRPYGKALRFFYKNFRLPRGSLRSLATSSYLSYTIFIMLWRCLKISFLLIAVAYIACVGDLYRRMIFDLRYGWTPAWHRFRRDFIALNASWMAVGRWIVHKTTSLMSRLR